MDREILFRGKRIDNGEWIEGDYAHDPDIKRAFILEHYFYILEGYGRERDIYFHDIIPETRGMYTGLTDKNGKKIFEGDIVEYHGKRYVIKYLEKYMRFSPSNAHAIFAVFDYTQSEILGNIHDNPELLKGE